MILKHLKNSHSYLIIVLLLFNILFFTTSYFTKSFQNIEGYFIYYNFIILFASFVLTSLHSVALNNLIYEKDIIKKSNVVLAFVFTLLNTAFIVNHKMMLFSLLSLFFLNYLLDLYKKKQPFRVVFNSGLILSVISFFIPNILFLFPLIIISLIIFRNVEWRTILIPFISLFIPYIFVWAYQVFLNSELLFPILSFGVSFDFISLKELLLHQKIWFSVVSTITIFSFFELFRWMYKKSIKGRESFTIIIFYFFISIYIFLSSENKDSIFVVLIPLSIIIGNFFVYHKKERWSGLLFLLFLFSSVFYRISMINM